MAKSLYILDGHWMIHRAYHARIPNLTNPAGEPTAAVHVFCNMLLSFLNDRKPDYLAMAVDGPTEDLLRRQQYPDYKATRDPSPEDFHPQAQRIIEIVRAMGLQVLEARSHEADDILATLATRFAGPETDVFLVSCDKDLDQLVNDHVFIYDPKNGRVLDAETIEAEKGYSPGKAVEIQTLAGDTSDNIPGIHGVGPKKAVALIEKYGTAEEVLARAQAEAKALAEGQLAKSKAELTPKLRENIVASAETLALSRRLVTLCRDVPLEVDLGAMRYQGVAAEAVAPVFAELGFNRLMEPLKQAAAGSGEAVDEAKLDVAQIAADGGRTSAADFEYECIDTEKALHGLAKELTGVNRLSVDTETTSQYAMWAELVGVCLAWKAGHAVYIPVRGPLGATTLDADLVREVLGPVLADPKVTKVGQNLKYDLNVLRQAGYEVAGEMFDTMIAAYVLDATRMTYKLDALAAEFLGHQCIPIEEVIGRGRNQTTMDAVPIETVCPYAAEDADVTLRLADVLAEKLQAEGLEDLFAHLEMPLMPVLADMERRGILLDPAELKRQETALSKRADALRDRIVDLAGRNFNVDSPKQLAEILFADMGLPVLKRKKTGPSTDSSVLEQLAVEHEIAAAVLDYRKLTKLIGTYLKALGQCIHPKTGRVHTSFHQAGTATGRLSSSDPNLQNIPVRTEEGRQIRSAFVAEKGCTLLSADYSQIELRMLAHLSEDATLIEAFQAGQDIHRIVAAEVFGVKIEDVTSEMRGRAKTVNFGIIYGQTAFGLSVTLRIARSEAAAFIRDYKARFPRIEEFLQTCVARAKDQGYVETIFGRRRRIGEIDSRNPQRRAWAGRLAINTVVQGSAADLIKQAMLAIDRRLRAEDRPSRMLLQIHDELVFEIPTGALDAEREMIVEEMTGAVKLKVPLYVDVHSGANWMEAK